MQLNVLELFAGIGGLSLGLERAGFNVVGQVEINPFARSILAKHWPEVPKHDDVRTALAWWFDGTPRPPVHVIAGGYPCQPESLAGTRRGTNDERWLWPEFARIVARLRPWYVIGENVMGHRTSGLRFVLRDLDRLGYTARAGIVSAGEMGAPHRRQRIFVLAADTSGARSGGAAEPGSARTAVETRPLADAEREPRGTRRPGDAGQGPRGRHADRGGVGHAVLADTAVEGRRAGRVDASGPGTPPGQRQDRAQFAGNPWWATEPDVGRVAYGIPGRVDRLRTLGNAIVPQVGEFVGRLLLSDQWLDGGGDGLAG